MDDLCAVGDNSRMTDTIKFPAIFTAADVASVAAAIRAGVGIVAFGSLSVAFAVADMQRVQHLVDELVAMDAARSNGVAEVEFRDRRTRFRSLDELMLSRASLLNALRALVVTDSTQPVKRRNPLRVRYVRYQRGY